MSADPANLRQRDEQLLHIVNNALADAARHAGDHLVCHPGCTQCCHGAFSITPLDALRLREAMAQLRTTDPSLAGTLEIRARAYLAEYAPTYPGNSITGILDSGETAEAAFEDFANEAPCPALNPSSGLCELYEARPIACRTFGPPVRLEYEADADIEEDLPAYALCELCFTTATEEEIAAAEMKIPRQQEQDLVQLLPSGDTIVAFCLVSPTAASTLP